jgi:APA family basic amino acid/polyamine antiporter
MPELQRTLSFPVVLIMAVMAAIGMNIYVLVQLGAWAAGGWGALLAVGILIILSLLFSLILAELVGMFPQSGGVYEYTKQAFGPFISFSLGWITLLNLNLSVAVVFVDAIAHLNPNISPFLLLGISIIFVIIFNWFAYVGMLASSRAIVFVGLVTLAAIIIFILAGVSHFSWANLATPPPDSAPTVPFVFAIIIGIFYMAEMFFGWENATFLAGEAKDPEKTMPRVMWISTIIISVLVLAFTVVAIGSVGAAAFGASAEPFLLLAETFFTSKYVTLVAFVIFLCSVGAIATWIVGTSRLVMSLAEDKLFIHQLAAVHPKHNTPYKAIIFQTIATIIFLVVAEANTNVLYDLIIPLDILMYLIVLFAFLSLRKHKPNQPRPFKVRFGVPIAAFLIVALLLTVIGWASAMISTSLWALWFDARLILLGIPVYLLLLFTYNPEAIIQFTEFFSYGSLWLENFILPKRIRREILIIFRELEDKHVLEYGAGVGTLTLHLAERVGPRGHIIATDISAKNLRILERRLKKRHITHVTTIHDPHQVNRIHPDVREVDIVYSVGMLSYIQDLQKVLRDIRRILPDHGKLCFVEYVDYFRILPNPKWLDDHVALREIFREAGFGVQVVKLHGFFWNYLFIYGEKTRHVEKVPYI